LRRLRMCLLRSSCSLGFAPWQAQYSGGAVALKHVEGLEAQAQKLQGMIATLHALIGTCKRGDRQECPIMQELARGAAAPDADHGKPARGKLASRKTSH
jgi:hypothetical protein